MTEEGKISQLVIERAAKWKAEAWPALAAAQPFHVKPRVGAKNKVAGKTVRKSEENKDGGGGWSSGGRKAVYIVVEAAILRFTRFGWH